MNIVENIAMNPDIHKPALVFSLEMPAQQIVLRMLSTFGRVSMRELSEGKVTTNQWHDIIRKVAMLTETDETMLSTTNFTLTTQETLLRLKSDLAPANLRQNTADFPS